MIYLAAAGCCVTSFCGASSAPATASWRFKTEEYKAYKDFKKSLKASKKA